MTDADGTRVVTLPLEEYVLGAVRAELSWPTLPAEARDGMVRIQAIISRTYAISNLDRHAAEGFDLCDGTHCQLYRRRAGTESDNDGVAASVAATRGQILTFEGRAVRAVYHSSCGGHTTAAEHVWSGPPLPYLQPVPDWFCSRAGGGKWSFSANEQQLRQALNADPRTAVGGRLDRIEIAERDAAGRATKVGIVGARRTVVKAEEFRAVMRQTFGPQSIRSTWFSIVRRANLFDFSGVGYGHGVGLCQTGAALRVQAGQSPAAVLAHYYPGTTLEPLTSLATLLTRRVNLHD